MGKIIYLVVSSWSGMDASAEHWYGHLHKGSYRDTEYLTKPLDCYECAKLNKKDGRISYHPGDPSERFANEQDVIEAGISAYAALKIDGILILGDPVVASPQRVIATSGSRYFDGFCPKADQIWQKWDALSDAERVDVDLTDEWQSLLEEYELTDWFEKEG